MEERADLTPGGATPRLPPAAPDVGAGRVVLAARGIVAYELARWPDGDPGELDLAVERLAVQGARLAVPIETLIAELKQLVQRHASTRHHEHECRGMREHLVSTLIEAYYRAKP